MVENIPPNPSLSKPLAISGGLAAAAKDALLGCPARRTRLAQRVTKTKNKNRLTRGGRCKGVRLAMLPHHWPRWARKGAASLSLSPHLVSALALHFTQRRAHLRSDVSTSCGRVNWKLDASFQEEDTVKTDPDGRITCRVSGAPVPWEVLARFAMISLNCCTVSEGQGLAGVDSPGRCRSGLTNHVPRHLKHIQGAPPLMRLRHGLSGVGRRQF